MLTALNYFNTRHSTAMMARHHNHSLDSFVLVCADCLSQDRDIIVFQGTWKQGIDAENC